MTVSTRIWIDMGLDRLGRRLARKLNAPSSGYQPFTSSDFDTLCRVLRPGDILLVEGRERISNAIKYLTQSTWSHAAVYVGDRVPPVAPGAEPHRLVEVNLGEGCVSAPLSKYACHNTRICRPVGLTPEECREVVEFMVARIGLGYDMRNIVDLVRYFLPTPPVPVPVRWRRRMLALGSGDPTRAICSSLIAHAFQCPCAIRSCRTCAWSRRGKGWPMPGARSCISATIRCSRRGISTCRPISRSSSRI